MALHWIWFALAVVALIGEAVTGTFYVLMIAVGLFVGGVLALAGAPLWMELTGAAFTTLLLLWLVYRWRGQKVNAQASASVNLDVGRHVTVDRWRPDGTARVWYRGAHWEAELEVGSTDQRANGPHEIVALEGSLLVIRPLQQPVPQDSTKETS